jgi:hypothetical protein
LICVHPSLFIILGWLLEAVTAGKMNRNAITTSTAAEVRVNTIGTILLLDDTIKTSITTNIHIVGF